MNKNVVTGMMMTLILTGMLTFASNVQRVEASGIIYIRADGSVDPDTAPISSVDNVTYKFTDNIYDSIVVERDNIEVDGAGYILQGSGSGYGMILARTSNVTVNNVEIREFYHGVYLYESFCIKIVGNNITKNSDHGVLGFDSFNNTIWRNNIIDNDDGIVFFNFSNTEISENNITDSWGNGLRLKAISASSIFGNNITNNKGGISLQGGCFNNSICGNNIEENGTGIRCRDQSSNNTITRNNIATHTYDGIGLYDSPHNTVFENNMTENWVGIRSDHSSHNIISRNIITDGNYPIWLDECSGGIICGNNITGNYFGIYVDSSSNNTISGNSISESSYVGIYVDSSSNNTISGNSISENNWYGIYLYESSSNTISGNNIANNFVGISLRFSSNNCIHHNNFVDNSLQVYSHDSTNALDDGYPSGGNYWSDYTSRYPAIVDEYKGENQDILGSDGIWDYPYEIDADNVDNYPLVEPWSPFPRTIGELKTEIEKCGSEGEIDNQGIVTSLLAKLNVAQKLVDKGKIDEAKSILEEDFIPQVQNLVNIHITQDAADVLIESAEYILSNL